MKFKAAGYLDVGDGTSDISEDRYDSVKAAKATCIFALELEEKFALLLDNFYEFEIELLKLAEATRIWPSRDHSDSMLERLKLDQRIVNLLTACRLYSDQTDHGISSLFGNPSDELSGVKSFKNSLYDDHWGYRFIEALRNHVQHSGLPVHTISYNKSRIPGAEQDYWQFTIIPQASVKNLAEDSAFKKSILTELMEKGEKIDLRPAVREYVECFGKLHKHLREKIHGKLTADRSIYEKAIDEFSTIEGKTVKFPRMIKENEDETSSEEVALVTEFLDHLDSFRKRNLTNRNLARSFAANTDQERA